MSWDYGMIEILFNRSKRLHRPLVSWVLVASCLMVAVPIFIFPVLREVFSASAPRIRPWWFITAVFVHDNTTIPMYLHLIGNVMVIAFFGTIAERLLGSARVLMLAGVALAAQLVVSVPMDTFGDGASGIAWAMAPLTLPVLAYYWKKHGWAALREPLSLVATALYIAIWLLVTIFSWVLELHCNEHLASGCYFCGAILYVEVAG